MQSVADGQPAPTHLLQDHADCSSQRRRGSDAETAHQTPVASPDIDSSSSSSPLWSPAEDSAARFKLQQTSPRCPVNYAYHEGQSSLGSSRRRRPSPLKMSLTGDKIDDSRQGRAGAWFSPRGTPTERTASPDATPTKMRGSPLGTSAPPSPGRPKPSSPARFSLFSSSVSAALKSIASSPVPAPQEDELANVDIEAALFPSGTPPEGDGVSPAAFKNLHMNATGLLRKFQSAYRHRTAAFRELEAEQEAQEEEKSEFETRTRHLKMQLEDMARKAAESEATMRELMDELNKEKKLRIVEQRAREKSSISSSMSTRSEDLDAEDDQRRSTRRRSGLTVKSDLSSDTDEDSVEEASVFSRSRSPTLTASTLDVGSLENMPPPPPPPSHTKPAMLGPPRAPRQAQPQMSTIQKLFKGMSSEAPKDDEMRAVYSCRNCQGQDASVAWDTASLLRDENRGLKKRVGELEEAVEEALDAVNGIRL